MGAADLGAPSLDDSSRGLRNFAAASLAGLSPKGFVLGAPSRDDSPLGLRKVDAPSLSPNDFVLGTADRGAPSPAASSLGLRVLGAPSPAGAAPNGLDFAA
jgi:hypothetical protein